MPHGLGSLRREEPFYSLPLVRVEPSRAAFLISELLKPPSVSALQPDYKAEEECTLSSVHSVAHPPEWDPAHPAFSEIEMGHVLILLLFERLRPKSTP